jgi:hypothetical protein
LGLQFPQPLHVVYEQVHPLTSILPPHPPLLPFLSLPPTHLRLLPVHRAQTYFPPQYFPPPPVTPNKRPGFSILTGDSPFNSPSKSVFDPHDPRAVLDEELRRFGDQDLYSSPVGLFGKNKGSCCTRAQACRVLGQRGGGEASSALFEPLGPCDNLWIHGLTHSPSVFISVGPPSPLISCHECHLCFYPPFPFHNRVHYRL